MLHYFCRQYKAAADKENVFKIKLREGVLYTFLAEAASEEEMEKWIGAILDLRVRQQ